MNSDFFCNITSYNINARVEPIIMSFLQNILTLKPREESGSKTSRKYRFQKDLSLFLLLEYHNSLDDYLFLFDFHEDLVILNSSSVPSRANFYQIKSKDGGKWTLNGILKKDGGKYSILGKLYLNKVNFGNETESLNFISNVSFSFKDLQDGSDSKILKSIKAIILSEKDLAECNQSLLEEFNVEDSEFEKITSFHTTILSNQDSSTHCIDKLERLKNSINPENKINSELAYRQILNEITIKTENTVSSVSLENLSDLIELKGISKSIFLHYLEKAGLYKSIDDEWKEIKHSLESCHISYSELLLFKTAWREMSATLIKDAASIPLQKIINDINSIIRDQSMGGGFSENMNLLQLINSIFPKIDTTFYDDHFVKCMIIKCLNEK